MSEYLFIGERQSPTAARKGWQWADGRLCASTLFRALQAIGIEPSTCAFGNAFEYGGDLNRWDLCVAFTHAHHGGTVVALGQKAARILADLGIPHICLIHPAARGAIRATERYQQHVAERLGR